MIKKHYCGGYTYPFIDYQTLREGIKCNRCGEYIEIKKIRPYNNGIDFEELILEQQEEY